MTNSLVWKKRAITPKMLHWTLLISAYLGAFMLNMWIGVAELNDMATLGLFLVVAPPCLVFFGFGGDKFKKPLALTLLAAFLAPFVHVADYEHHETVWIVGDKTTLSNSVLMRSPFAPFARSVTLDKTTSIDAVATTRDSKRVVGTVQMTMRMTTDERELINATQGLADPDKDISGALKKILAESFANAVRGRSLVELQSGNLQVEFDTGNALKLQHLGVLRNGAVVVSDLHAFFRDR